MYIPAFNVCNVTIMTSTHSDSNFAHHIVENQYSYQRETIYDKLTIVFCFVLYVLFVCLFVCLFFANLIKAVKVER